MPVAGRDTWVQQRVRLHYPNGFRMVEVSPDCPVTDDLRETYDAARATYALLLEAA